jgi:hypothetical protein
LAFSWRRFAATACYRAGQFFRALVARPSAGDEALAQQMLSGRERALFQSMSLADKRHALAMWRTLLDAGQADRELLKAALLHDVGKNLRADGTRRAWGIPLPHRVLIVLLEAWRPGLLSRLADAHPRSIFHPFHVYLEHPRHGAALAQAAGCSPLTVSLIRRHHEPPETATPRSREDKLLALLQRADSQN